MPLALYALAFACLAGPHILWKWGLKKSGGALALGFLQIAGRAMFVVLSYYALPFTP
jgi:hypothetical protein